MSDAAVDPGRPIRKTVVTVSPRVAPGLLTAAAWDAIRSGRPVYLDSDSPQRAAIEAAGVTPRAATGLEELLADDAWVLVVADDAEGAASAGDVEVVAGSIDLPGSRLLDAVAVMDRLRSPGGCPWDAEQTHDSLKKYLLEEAYEAYEAIEDGDSGDLLEELGDVLLQVLFHARIAAEDHETSRGAPSARWTIDDVAAGLTTKLVERHPHVFADATVSGAEEVNTRWEQLKAEQKGRTSVTDGVPLSMAALSLAAKLRRRASRLGAGPVEAFDPGDDLGGRLWQLVAAHEDDDAELSLRATARRFRDELLAAESALRAEDKDPAATDLDGWQAAWRSASYPPA